jgi:UDP-N-acetylmuramyl pentapeptide phosphotransferase/UDP-N-acetylglucosamine-1-phosphate transferase
VLIPIQFVLAGLKRWQDSTIETVCTHFCAREIIDGLDGLSLCPLLVASFPATLVGLNLSEKFVYWHRTVTR